MNNLYLHISSGCLANYIVSGTIAPAKYYSNRFQDIQSQNSSVLLLCKAVFASEENCSMELTLSDAEDKALKWINDEYAVFNGWLPMSRIVNIFFKEASQATQTVWDINNGAGYVADSMLKVPKQPSISNQIPIIKSINVQPDGRIEDELNKYNYLLGVLSFVRILREDYNDDTLNFSNFAISIHSFFSEIIKKQYQNQGGILDTRYDSVLNDDSKANNLKSLLLSDLSYEIVNEKYRTHEQSDLPVKFSLIDVEKLDSSNHYYSFFVASNYRVNGPKSDEDLVSDMLSSKLKHKLDGVCFILGMHWGYKKLRNEYAKGEKRKKVKFSLDSMFDLVTLEDLYKFVTGRDSLSSEILKRTVPPIKVVKSLNYITYTILDQVLCVEKRKYDKGIMSFVETIVKRLESIFSNQFVKLDKEALELALFQDVKYQYEKDINDVVNDSSNIFREMEKKISNLTLDNESLKNQVDELQSRLLDKEKSVGEDKGQDGASSDKIIANDTIKNISKNIPFEITNENV